MRIQIRNTDYPLPLQIKIFMIGETSVVVIVN